MSMNNRFYFLVLLVVCFFSAVSSASEVQKNNLEKLILDVERIVKEYELTVSSNDSYTGQSEGESGAWPLNIEVDQGANNNTLIEDVSDKLLSLLFPPSPYFSFELGPTLYKSSETIEALEQLRTDGDALGTMRLAERYKSGRGVSKDMQRACKLYGEAFIKGLPDLYTDILDCMGSGYFTSINANSPEEVIKLAAEQYEYNVDSFLAEHLFNGLYVPLDKERAKSLFESAGSDGVALNYLGQMYRDGDFVTRDLKKARQYFIDGSIAGESLAMYNLALSYQYEDSIGLEPDLAMYWMRKSALEGYAFATMAYAQSLLKKGRFYDPLSALVFFKKASSFGIIEADCYINELTEHFYDTELDLSRCD
ncbi:sel1 repeat family protein [Glaciecola sp. MH2013]|uniref:tetratricopeptide repeat protein n=1 Tax=Glaciecola sp. MH2013 TaxID=2785524 RepID=UPI0018A08423|nr:tetratricopeptide repeat protein [Glaciecola sp. MH2013]MBF7073980.1 sel1 repeat family protein [Glaciecola sp. MH2013]